MSESLPNDVYQSIGDEIGDLLQQAHDWAERTRAEAEAEAARVTAEAAATAKRVVEEAETKAAQLRSESEEKAARVKSESEALAEQLRSESEALAERVTSESEKHAERVRSESEGDATKLRTSAEAYANQVRADAEAEAQSREQEADARVVELRDIETEARQRVDSLKKRLLSIAEQLDDDVGGGGTIEGSPELEISNFDGAQQEQQHDDLRVEEVHEEDESLGMESERLATGGTKT
jgi:regulator of protease activity HflC (stomatin/prohibitin superfamily)